LNFFFKKNFSVIK